MVGADDGSNETRPGAQGLASGVALKISRPKRKKAFHRALKRGEHWAVWEDNMQRIMNIMATEFYSPMIYDPLPFLGLLRGLDKK